MYKRVSVPVFQGLFTSLDGQAPLGASFFMQNAAVGAGIIKFRPGFTPRRTRPTSFEACLGFQYVRKFSESSSVAEVISIEKRGGVVKPYSYWNGTTTEITNSGTALSLENVQHLVTPFYGKAYVIAPGASKTLYRHDIGSNTSFTALQDSAYTAPTASPSLVLSASTLPATYAIQSTDTVVAVSTNGYGITGGITYTAAGGKVTVSANAGNRGGQHRTKITVTTAAQRDWTGSDYVTFKVSAKAWYPAYERTITAPRIKCNGVWTTLTSLYTEYVASTADEYAIMCRIKGIADLNKVEAFEFTIGGYVEDQFGTGDAFVIEKPVLGGVYICNSSAGGRLWDGNLENRQVTYAARGKNGGSYTPINQGTINGTQSLGALEPIYASNVGGRVFLTSEVLSGGWVDIEFLRLMADGVTWKIIGTKANSGTPSVQDVYEENQLTGLVTATGVTGSSTVNPTPVFRTSGLKDGCRYKGFMCWVFAGSFQNVCYSRVLSENYPSAAEELYSSSITYGDDPSQPATYTLSEGGDEPRRVLADDDTIYILGNLGVYVQAGDTPSTMSPIRPVPESSPLAGIKACCIFPPSESRSGLVWLDNQGRVWFTTASRRYNDVISSEPIELTKGVRGFIRKYLLDEQRSEYGFTDFSTALMSYSQHDDSLRVSMGNREVVYRPQHLQTGKRFWEFHQYTLRHITSSVSTITSDWRSTGVSAGSVSPGDVAWSAPSEALESDNSYATAGSMGFGTSRTTETLRFEGFTPDNVIPLGSTITNFEYRVERSKSGDLAVTETTVQPRQSSASAGTNRSTSYALTSTDTQQTFVPSVLPTVAQLNSGAIGLDLKYTQETWLAAWNNPANWTIVVSPTSPSVYSYATAPSASHTTAYTVTYTWIGSGTAPTQVWATYTGTTDLSCVAPASGTGSTTNGLGSTSTGDIYNNVGIPPDPGSSASLGTSSVLNERLTLTAGVATKNITMVSTATVPAAKMRATHTLTAGIYTPTPATVQVDEVVARVSYQAPVVSDPGVTSVQGTTSIDKGGFLWVRSSGEVDEVGYDSASNREITGVLRDGGKAAPDGKFELGEFVFPSMARINYVATTTGTYRETVTVQATSNRLSSWSSAVDYGVNHRFGVNLTGQRINVRFLFTESLDSISSADIEFVQLSTQRNK